MDCCGTLPKVLQPADKMSFFLLFQYIQIFTYKPKRTYNNYFSLFCRCQNGTKLEKTPAKDINKNDSVQKQICIIHFEDCKHEEKFDYLHECQNAEERSSKIHDLKNK